MRSKRKNRTDIKFASQGGLLDLFDNAIKGTYYINDDEYDYICMNASDEELQEIVNEKPTFTEAKKMLLIVDKYMTMFEEEKDLYL